MPFRRRVSWRFLRSMGFRITIVLQLTKAGRHARLAHGETMLARRNAGQEEEGELEDAAL